MSFFLILFLTSHFETKCCLQKMNGIEAVFPVEYIPLFCFISSVLFSIHRLLTLFSEFFVWRFTFILIGRTRLDLIVIYDKCFKGKFMRNIWRHNTQCPAALYRSFQFLICSQQLYLLQHFMNERLRLKPNKKKLSYGYHSLCMIPLIML